MAPTNRFPPTSTLDIDSLSDAKIISTSLATLSRDIIPQLCRTDALSMFIRWYQVHQRRHSKLTEQWSNVIMHWVQKLAGAGFSEGDIIRQVERWKDSKSFSLMDPSRRPPSEIEIRRAMGMIEEHKRSEPAPLRKELKRKVEEISDFDDWSAVGTSKDRSIESPKNSDLRRENRLDSTLYNTPTRERQEYPRNNPIESVCTGCGLRVYQGVHHGCTNKHTSQIMLQWEREISSRPKKELDEEAALEIRIAEKEEDTASETGHRNKMPRFEIRGRASSERLQVDEADGSNHSPEGTTSLNTRTTQNNVRVDDIDDDDQNFGKISNHRHPDNDDRRYNDLPSLQSAPNSNASSDPRTPGIFNLDEIDIDDDYNEEIKMDKSKPELAVRKFAPHIQRFREKYPSFSEVVNPVRIRPTALDLWDASERYIAPL